MILVDTSGLLAALSPSQRLHRECAAVLTGARGPFLLPAYVLAELDHLVRRLIGLEAELALLGEVVREAYQVVDFGPTDLQRACQIIEQHSDHDIGLADASLVVLSERLGITDLLTLDERHFRTLRGVGGEPFRILPADAKELS